MMVDVMGWAKEYLIQKIGIRMVTRCPQAIYR